MEVSESIAVGVSGVETMVLVVVVEIVKLVVIFAAVVTVHDVLELTIDIFTWLLLYVRSTLLWLNFRTGFVSHFLKPLRFFDELSLLLTPSVNTAEVSISEW